MIKFDLGGLTILDKIQAVLILLGFLIGLFGLLVGFYNLIIASILSRNLKKNNYKRWKDVGGFYKLKEKKAWEYWKRVYEYLKSKKDDDVLVLKTYKKLLLVGYQVFFCFIFIFTIVFILALFIFILSNKLVNIKG